MYNCKRCGHALPSNSTLCPNCGAMMDSRQLEILIKLDFFSEFGKRQKLLETVEMFNKIYSKG